MLQCRKLPALERTSKCEFLTCVRVFVTPSTAQKVTTAATALKSMSDCRALSTGGGSDRWRPVFDGLILLDRAVVVKTRGTILWSVN